MERCRLPTRPGEFRRLAAWLRPRAGGSARGAARYGRAVVLAAVGLLVVACTPAASPAPTAQPGSASGASGTSEAASVASATAPPLQRVRFAYTAISSYQAPAILARDAGLFQKHGLDVELVYLAGGSRGAQGLVSGDADLAYMSGDAVITASLNGADTAMIMGGANYVVHNLLAPPSVRGADDLRGKSVGFVTFGSVPHFGAVYALRRLGLQPGVDVTLVQVAGNPEVLAALQSGAIAGGMLTTPLLSQGQAMGFHVLYDLKAERVPYPSLTLASTRGYLARNEATTQAFIKAMIETLRLYKQDRPRSIQLLREVTKVEDQALLEETLDDTLPQFDDVPYPTLQGIQNVLDWLAESDAKAQGKRPEEFVDDRALRQVETSGFPQTLGIAPASAR